MAQKSSEKATRSNGAARTSQVEIIEFPAHDYVAAISRRAYELYLARGAENGHDLEDWLRAERELSSSAAAHQC